MAKEHLECRIEFNPDRMAQNLDVFDFELTDDVVEGLGLALVEGGDPGLSPPGKHPIRQETRDHCRVPDPVIPAPAGPAKDLIHRTFLQHS